VLQLFSVCTKRNASPSSPERLLFAFFAFDLFSDSIIHVGETSHKSHHRQCAVPSSTSAPFRITALLNGLRFAALQLSGRWAAVTGSPETDQWS